MEDEHDVVEAMRTDAAEELTALLAGKSIGNDSEVEGEAVSYTHLTLPTIRLV